MEKHWKDYLNFNLEYMRQMKTYSTHRANNLVNRLFDRIKSNNYIKFLGRKFGECASNIEFNKIRL